VPLCHRHALDQTDAGRYIGVSRSTIETLVRNKTLPSFTVGDRRLIRRVDLEAYVDARLAAQQESR
jgi:excisionase family DNA binding protein